MASMTIRNIDDQIKSRLRVQAARNGRSMEDEARDILRAALSTEAEASQQSLIGSIRRRIAPLGGVDLDLPARDAISDRVDLDA
ncbi:FitA-like ribbon-helix-helix domain-containing protein [Paraburkholderia phosphatilytica]|uniref:FitA-like ribbon-helix-helix domain-containing protein n=1 Tax=Paraburkholderia phosphatilytica TaxID=2282883 RepID=UPI000E52B739|nr:plasmid stabilization protein [Paraburkholderia phosphatilytica]